MSTGSLSKDFKDIEAAERVLHELFQYSNLLPGKGSLNSELGCSGGTPGQIKSRCCCSQDIVRAVEVVSRVVKELAKIGGADQAAVNRLTAEFLDIVKVRPSSVFWGQLCWIRCARAHISRIIQRRECRRCCCLPRGGWSRSSLMSGTGTGRRQRRAQYSLMRPYAATFAGKSQ
jgi:hypothetical protein